MTADRTPSRENTVRPVAGAAMLLAFFLLVAGGIFLLVSGVRDQDPVRILSAVGIGVLDVLLLIGFFIVNPNDARMLVFFGRYRGTVKENGFFWVNPFTVRKRVSMKAHNLNGDRLKVNDKAGNPIEIAAVVVWRVRDTFAAVFDVEH